MTPTKPPEQRRDEYARKYAEAHIDVEWAVIDGWDAARADMQKHPPEHVTKLYCEVKESLWNWKDGASAEWVYGRLERALKAFDEARKTNG